MASNVLTVDNVNAFLPFTKLQVSNTSEFASLEQARIDIVWGKLRNKYDTSGWQDASSTPRLVKTIVALMVAGDVYGRQFAEESTEGIGYGQRRLEEGYALLEGVLEGHYDLGDDVLYWTDDLRTPSFYPTEPKFEMDVQF